MNNNPIHPGCDRPSRKVGKTDAGTQRYLCPQCGKKFSDGRKGRPLIGDRPLTQAERDKRYREKRKGHNP